LRLLADDDHYACITTARDEARQLITLGCDLYGLAAETSVLVPMERAAQLGRQIRIYYRRTSRFLTEGGRYADEANAANRGILLTKVNGLHGKFLTWDDNAVAISSFNWLATVVGTRARGAELGVLARGPKLPEVLQKKFEQSSSGIMKVPPESAALGA